MKKLPLKIINLCKEYRTNGLSHRDISKKLNIGLGSVSKYCKDITLTRAQHLFLMRRNLPRITAEQRRNAGLHNPNKFIPKYSKKDLTEFIKSFVKNKKRIPTKREVTSHKPYVRLFGSWNNAIIAAGFEPNPVMFSKKHLANDGHKCDSLAEKIIDDWLFFKGIPHETKIPYNKNGMTADFKVGEILIEFLGLTGQLEKYDKLVKIKEKLWKEQKLKVIKIYPKDLFPVNKLNQIIKF